MAEEEQKDKKEKRDKRKSGGKGQKGFQERKKKSLRTMTKSNDIHNLGGISLVLIIIDELISSHWGMALNIEIVTHST